MMREKQTAYDFIEQNADAFIGVSDRIWEYAELSLKEFKSKDDEFHRAFFEITHKMEIYQLQQKLQAHSDRVRNLSLSIVADEAIIEEHAGIVDCIRKGDAPLAKSRLKLHLQRYQIDAAAIRRAFPQYFKGKS